MQRYSNEIVIFLGASIFVGGLFPDFRNNQTLILAVTFSAVIFSLFDLVGNLKKDAYRVQQMLLFVGIFSIVVVPYLQPVAPWLIEQNNLLTLMGLAIVLFLIGFKQRNRDIEELKNLKEYIDRTEKIIEEQNKVLEEQNKIIKAIKEKQN